MKYLIGLGVATLLIVAFAYFWLFSGNELQTAQQEMGEAVVQLETQSGSKDPKAELNGFGSMNDLLGREKNLECQITTIDNTVANEGTFFVADHKIRGDFITQSPEQEEAAVSSIIVMEDTMYVWTEIGGESYGVKSNLQAAKEADVQTQEPVSLDERVKYSCQSWEQVDQSIFIPPTDVLFQDMSAVLQGGMEYGTVYEEGEMPY
jgi:predicted RNA-binding protein